MSAPRISLQMIFTAAWNAFIVGDAKPARNNFSCSYLTSDGRKCAVGLVLPDGHLAQSRVCPFYELTLEYQDLWDDQIRSMAEYRLNMFQRRLHDDLSNSQGWILDKPTIEKKYRQVAKEFELTVPE